VSAGQFTAPITVLQRVQMTQIGAHHGRHRLTCRLRQIGGAAFGPIAPQQSSVPANCKYQFHS
jgi:hypothetical protein